MKHVLALLCAVVAVTFAGIIVWSNRTALTTTHLAFAGGCLAIAFALAVPADFKCACATVAQYAPLAKREGGTS